MNKEWVVQAELNGRFGAVRRSDANGTRRTFETREAAQKYCDMRNEEKNDKNSKRTNLSGSVGRNK